VVQRALDDRGAHDRQAVAGLGPAGLGDALGEGLGERVDVRPAEALGTHPAGVDQAVLHPRGAGGLGELGDELRAGLAVAGLRGLQELAQLVGLAGFELDPLASRLRRFVLGEHIHAVLQCCLWLDALANTAHVAGRHVHDVRVALRLQKRAVQSDRAADVRVERLVDRRVE
jgi:hypothetical protein